jgi:hypothetical protein
MIDELRKGEEAKSHEHPPPPPPWKNERDETLGGIFALDSAREEMKAGDFVLLHNEME